MRSADEDLLAADPYPTRDAWCAARVEATEPRLAALPADVPLIVVNHFPLNADLAVLPRIPRFSIWCGTRSTHDWHKRFRATVAVSGHLHVPRTDWIDGVRFEEVSFGYPPQRRPDRTVDSYLREILPGLPAQPRKA